MKPKNCVFNTEDRCCEECCIAYDFCKFRSMNIDEISGLTEFANQKEGNIRYYRINYSYRRNCSRLLVEALNNMINDEPLHSDFEAKLESSCYAMMNYYNIRYATVKEVRNVEFELYEDYVDISGIGIIEYRFNSINNIPTLQTLSTLLKFLSGCDPEEGFYPINCDVDLI